MATAVKVRNASTKQQQQHHNGEEEEGENQAMEGTLEAAGFDGDDGGDDGAESQLEDDDILAAQDQLPEELDDGDLSDAPKPPPQDFVESLRHQEQASPPQEASVAAPVPQRQSAVVQYAPRHVPQYAPQYAPQQPLSYPALSQVYGRPVGKKRNVSGRSTASARRRRAHNPYMPKATAPDLSSAAVSEVDSDTASLVSSLSSTSSTSKYRSGKGGVREKGGVVGLMENLSEFDFVCPHCVKRDVDRHSLVTVSFPCCSRRAHYKCMARVSNVHNLAQSGVPACIQCLRPSDISSFQVRLEAYHRALPQTDDGDQDDSDEESDEDGAISASAKRLKQAWSAYNALGAYLKQRGMVKGIGAFLRSDDRTKPPQIDWDQATSSGVDTKTLLKAGWSLETVTEELLERASGRDWKAKLRLDRNTVLDMRLSDMIYMMRYFELHPYELRADFGIKLRDLWTSSDRRHQAGSTAGSSSSSRGSMSGSQSPRAANGEGRQGALSSQEALEEALQTRAHERGLTYNGGDATAQRSYDQTTDQICEQQGVLSPRKLAVLGFDLHHMIIMGFCKDHFANFPAFTLDDWLTHLGFRKPHWGILRLSKDDFTAPSGILSDLPGWRLDILMQRWGTTPTELLQMGVLDPKQLQQILHPSLPVAVPLPAGRPHPNHYFHPQRQPQLPQQRRQHPSMHYAPQAYSRPGLHPQVRRGTGPLPGYAPHPYHHPQRPQQHRQFRQHPRVRAHPARAGAAVLARREPARNPVPQRSRKPRGNVRLVRGSSKKTRRLGNEYGI